MRTAAKRDDICSISHMTACGTGFACVFCFVLADFLRQALAFLALAFHGHEFHACLGRAAGVSEHRNKLAGI